jgi:hypothetical protein
MNNNDTNNSNGYDSARYIIIENINQNSDTQVYSIPYRPTHSNEKRLICFSIINNDKCAYGKTCTYAHSIEEQVIDKERKYMYQLILDRNLMNFYSLSNSKIDDIYKQLLFFTYICNKCSKKKCTGGFNCRNGVCDIFLKLCKNDLLTGECLNKIVEIEINNIVLKKLCSDDFEPETRYLGCINGHHLTQRNFLPYHKYMYCKEYNINNQYKFNSCIDAGSLENLYSNDNLYYNCFFQTPNYDSSTDDEVDSWFMDNNFDE